MGKPNPDKYRESRRKHDQTEHGREVKRRLGQAYYLRHRERVLANAKARRAKDRNRPPSTLYKYGLSRIEFFAMVAKQNNCCAICDRDFAKLPPRHRCIDHDHQTGAVRALLCHNCNVMIGGAREDAKVLERAIEYLRVERNG